MTSTSKLLRIASRKSRLALWQAEHVQALLRGHGHTVQLLGMTTQGDQILDRALSKVGGKGLFVKELETALGRVPSRRYGPRALDIDILFYGELELQLPELEIPHPRLSERAFLLQPLAVLVPDFHHPALDGTVAELLLRRSERAELRCHGPLTGCR